MSGKNKVKGVDDLLEREARRVKLENEYKQFFLKHPEFMVTLKVVKGTAAMIGFVAGVVAMGLIWLGVHLL